MISGLVSVPRTIRNFVMIGSLLVGASAPALAQSGDNRPVIRFGEASLVDPSTAWTYYQGEGVTSVARASNPDRDVDELARALRNDVDIIYEHVRDNVDVVWTFGLTKGARGAAIDGFGTPFDQAHLMVELLRTSGYSASYIYGTITLTGTEFAAWTGVDTASAATSFLANGGFPATVNGTGETINSVTMAHIWVEVVIDSSTYLFDPSYKPHTEIAGRADLESDMGYTRAGFLTTAQNGLTLGSGAVRTVNTSGIRSSVTTYASNLIAALDNPSTGVPGAHLEDVIGGREIVSYGGAVLRQTSLAYVTSSTAAWANDIPDSFRTALTVSLPDMTATGDTPSVTLFADEIYARRLILRQGPASPYRLSLLLDGVEMAWTNDTSPSGPTATAAISLTVNHPYAADASGGTPDGDYMDESLTRTVDVILPAAVVAGFGVTERGLFNLMASEMDADRERIVSTVTCGGPSCSTTYTPISEYDRSKVLIGASYLTQSARIAEIYDRLAEGRTQHHHTLGFVSSVVDMDGNNVAGQGIRVDLDGGYSITNLGGDADREQGQARAFAATLGALDGSVVHQILDTVYTVSAASKFDWANTNQSTADFYEVTAANWSTVSTSLFTDITDATARTGHLNVVQAYTDAGYTALVPKNGALGPADTYGSGTPTTNLEEGAAFIAYMPDDSAFANVVIRFQADQDVGGGSDARVFPDVRTQPSADELAAIFSASGESEGGVSTASGTAAYVPDTDITTGSGGFPYGLAFQRAYRAGGPTSDGLGDGWTHNYDSRVYVSSSGLEALGQSRGARAAYSIAAFYATLDVLTDQTQPVIDPISLDERILPPFILDAWADEIEHNTYTVTSGAGGEQLMELANGNIDPALGSLTRLTVTGSIATVVDNSRTRFDYSGLDFAVLSPSGVLNEFSYWSRDEDNGEVGVLNHGFHIDRIRFPYGVDVTLTYDTNARLTTVANNLTRELDLSYGTPAGGTLTNPGGGLISIDAALLSVSDGSPNVTGRTVNFAYSVASGTPSNLGFSSRFLQLTTVTDLVGFDWNYLYEGPNLDLAGDFYDTWTQGDPFPTTHSLLRGYIEPERVSPLVSMHFSSRGRVTHTTDILGATTTLYIAPRRVETVDALANSSSTYANRMGLPIRAINALGHETSFEYDNFGRVVQTTMPEGNYTTFAYDAQHNLTTSTAYPRPCSPQPCTDLDPISTSAVYATVTGTYGDIYGLPSSVTDAMGEVTTFAYYANSGLLHTSTLPTVTAGTPVTTYTYNTKGQVLTVTDAEGMVTSATYVAGNGNLSSVTQDDGAGRLNLTTSYTYDDVGNVATVTYPEGNVVDYVRDARRRVRESGNTVTNRRQQRDFNARGRPSMGRVRIWDDVTQAYIWTEKNSSTYDLAGRVTASISWGDVTAYTYDALGRVTHVRNPELEVSQRIYDALGRVVETRRAVGTSMEFTDSEVTYGTSGQVLDVTDGNGNITNYTYDDHFRLYRTIFPDMTYEQYAYNDAGNLTSRLTRNGDLIQFAFDELGRATTKTVPGLPTITYAYDLVGRTVGVDDTSGDNWDFAFDTVGRMTSVTEVHQSNRTVSYTYDDNSRMTRLTWPDGYYVDYAYDDDNRVTSVTDDGATVLAAYTYDTRDRPRSVTYGNGVVTDLTWEPDSDLDTLTHTFAGAQSVEFDYGYDRASRLVSESVDDATFRWSDAASDITSYTANNLNQYTQIDVNSPSSTDYPDYDDNGNLTDWNGHQFAYDAENRLTQAIMAAPFSNTVDFTYDPFGRRESKSVQGGSSTNYLNAGINVIATFNGLGGLLQRYVYGPGTDNPIAQVADDGQGGYVRTYLHANRLGTVVATSDDNGDQADTYTYDPYGVPDTYAGVAIRYTGRWLDAETGLYYYRARYYSADLGRFLQTDPIGYGDGLNIYAYTGNEPISRDDPSGTTYGCNDCSFDQSTHGGDMGHDVVISRDPGTSTNNSFMRIESPRGDIVIQIWSNFHVIHFGAGIRFTQFPGGTNDGISASTYYDIVYDGVPMGFGSNGIDDDLDGIVDNEGWGAAPNDPDNGTSGNYLLPPGWVYTENGPVFEGDGDGLDNDGDGLIDEADEVSSGSSSGAAGSSGSGGGSSSATGNAAQHAASERARLANIRSCGRACRKS